MLGYACINSVLSEQPKSKRITTNRSMIKRTFLTEGKNYASQLALQNCLDLLKILQWNEEHDIRFFRISSEIFPWASEYKISSLPDYKQIRSTLEEVGKFAKQHNHRLTTHPGPFNKLCSPKDNVVKNTIRDLEIHGELFDLIGLSRTPYNKINIHVGATYGNKSFAVNNFISNFHKLPQCVKQRLTVENDDKPSLYSVVDLYNMIYEQIGVPIVFDYHHHIFCSSSLSHKEALHIACSTWGDIKPVVHYSESKRDELQDENIKPQAHSDFIYYDIPTYGCNVDVMIEAKAKEQALLNYRTYIERKKCG